jgi:hypothetical protein
MGKFLHDETLPPLVRSRADLRSVFAMPRDELRLQIDRSIGMKPSIGGAMKLGANVITRVAITRRVRISPMIVVGRQRRYAVSDVQAKARCRRYRISPPFRIQTEG